MQSKNPKQKIIVVMPAYNAEKTLELTYQDLPHNLIDKVILVDDGSTDNTVLLAKNLGISVFLHRNNYGYGANQKTCYREALISGASIVVMVHPDYQYDPKVLPQLIKPIIEGKHDIVLGSRMLGISPYKQGMPIWKFIANKILTRLENRTFGLDLSEYHTGYRAYSRKALESVNFYNNSDSFVFDQEIIAQFITIKLSIGETSVPVRYFPEASSVGFVKSTIYGLKIITLCFKFILNKYNIWKIKQFQSPQARYISL